MKRFSFDLVVVPIRYRFHPFSSSLDYTVRCLEVDGQTCCGRIFESEKGKVCSWGGVAAT